MWHLVRLPIGLINALRSSCLQHMKSDDEYLPDYGEDEASEGEEEDADLPGNISQELDEEDYLRGALTGAQPLKWLKDARPPLSRAARLLLSLPWNLSRLLSKDAAVC